MRTDPTRRCRAEGGAKPDAAGGLPLRIRLRGDSGRCHLEWEALESLVRAARRSRLGIEIECITAQGSMVVLSLV